MDTARPEDISAGQRAVLTIGIMLATGLQFIDGTIVAVVLTHMQGSLSVTQEQIAWVATAYLVTAAMFMPVAGWLAGYFGRRRMLLVGVFLFTVLSATSGTTDALEQIVPLRILLGLCGAILVPLSQAAMLDIYPREKHGMAMALWGIATTLGPAVTPMMAGYFAETYSWRWAFYSILPFGALSFVIMLAMLPEGIRQRGRRFDMTGFLLLVAAVAALQLMINRGEREDWFESPEIWIEAAVAVAGFYMFIVHVALVKQPFLNLALLRDRNYVGGLLLVLLTGPTQYATVVIMPLMVQVAYGYPILTAGIIMTPRGVATILSMAMAGWLMPRMDSRVIMIIGFIMLIAANYLVAFFGAEVGFWQVMIASFGQGIGMGFTLVPLTTIAYSTLSPALRPEAAAFFNLARGLSGAMSVAIIIAILSRSTQTTRSFLVKFINPVRELLHGADAPLMWDTEAISGLAALNLEVNHQAMLVGFQNSFLIMMAVPAAGLLLTLLLGKPKTG